MDQGPLHLGPRPRCCPGRLVVVFGGGRSGQDRRTYPPYRAMVPGGVERRPPSPSRRSGGPTCSPPSRQGGYGGALSPSCYR